MGYTQNCEIWHLVSLGTLIRIQEEPIWGTMWGPYFGHKRVIFWPFLGLLIHWVVKWKPGHSCRLLVLFWLLLCLVKLTCWLLNFCDLVLTLIPSSCYLLVLWGSASETSGLVLLAVKIPDFFIAIRQESRVVVVWVDLNNYNAHSKQSFWIWVWGWAQNSFVRVI